MTKKEIINIWVTDIEKCNGALKKCAPEDTTKIEGIKADYKSTLKTYIEKL